MSTSITDFYVRHPLILPEWASVILQAFPQGAVFYDLETTGLSPMVDAIIELAAVKVTAEGITTFSTLINPQVAIGAHSTAIHGINDLMVANAPKLSQVMPDFLLFTEKLPILAHNAKFDSGFIAWACHQCGLALPHLPVYCSLLLSKKAFVEFSSHRLSHLVKELSLPLANHHRALDDSIACLGVVAKGLIKYANIHRLKEESFLFNLSDYSALKNFEVPEHLKGISEKIQKNHLIFINYRGGSYKNQFRPILPTSFLPMPGGHVLYALCLHTGLYKSFGLNKIREWREMKSEELALWAKEMAKFNKVLNS